MDSTTEPDSLHPHIAASLTDVVTERLDLRRFRLDDLEGLATVFSNSDVWRFPYGRAFTREETEEFINDQIHHWESFGFGCWAARERGSDRVIGFVGISVPTFLPEILPAVEVGWRFEPSSWGKGYASEGGRAALDEAFSSLGLLEVWSVTQIENSASSAVCEHLGMRMERSTLVPANEKRGELDALLFRITERQWNDSRSAR